MLFSLIMKALYSICLLWMPFLRVLNAQEEFDIRLTGGSNTREGRLEAYSEGRWGSVCDYKWDLADADVVCKQLNLSYAITALRNAAFGQGKGHVHLWSLDCRGDENNISGCVRVDSGVACPHTQDASVICSDRGMPQAYDIRIIGGSRPSTGQVEFYINKQWGTLCSTPWSLVEANTVCLQSGYWGALITEGNIPVPIARPLPIYNGTVNCTKTSSTARGYNLFGCQNNLKLSNSTCERPNSVACARHQVELPVRLFGGKKRGAGRVEVSYGGIWWAICPEQWDLSDANVVCHQLGYNDSADFRPSATVTYPTGHDTRFYLMNKVNCTGEESNIGLCARVYGSHECATGDFASVTCVDRSYKRKDRTFNKVVIITVLCLLLIPTFLLVLLLVVFCLYKKRKKENDPVQQTSYSPVTQAVKLHNDVNDKQKAF